MQKNIFVRILMVIGYAILSFVLMALGQIIGSLMTIPLAKSSDAGLQFSASYFLFIGIWISVILFMLIFKKQRKFLPKIGKGGKGNNVKTALLIGLPIGIGLNLLCAFIAILHGDLYLSFSAFQPLMVILFIVAVGIQSGAEELCDRFFLYQNTKELLPEWPIAPVIINAVIFSAMHLVNPGVTPLSLANIVVVGVLYSLVIYYFDSFWAVVVAHTSWNFCQSILLGLPNSGIVSAYSVFGLDASTARDSFAYNVNFGIEGTVTSTVVLTAAIVIIVILGRKKQANNEQCE